MRQARELNLLRDSNALMRSREAAKEAEAKEAVAAAASMKSEVEPLQKAKAVAEKEVGALTAQLEQERKESKNWQKRFREQLDKTGKSVGQEAYEQLERKGEELSRQIEVMKKEVESSKAAKEKAETERDESKKLETNLEEGGRQVQGAGSGE